MHVHITYADGQTVSLRGGLEQALVCFEAAKTWGSRVLRARVYDKYSGLPEGFRLLAMDGEKFEFEEAA